MNEPPKTLTQAVDDLRLIRQVLDQTATSFRTLAPEFFPHGGWSGWFYGVLSCLVIWPDTLAFLFPEAFAGWDPTTGCPPRPVRPPPLGPGGLVGLPAGPVHPVAAQEGHLPRPGGEGAGHLAGAAGALPPAVPAAGGGFQYHPPCPCPLNPQVLPGITLGPSSTTAGSSCPSSSPGSPWWSLGSCCRSGRCLCWVWWSLPWLSVPPSDPGVPVLATILPLYAFLVGVGLVQVFYQPVALLVLARRLRRRPEGV